MIQVRSCSENIRSKASPQRDASEIASDRHVRADSRSVQRPLVELDLDLVEILQVIDHVLQGRLDELDDRGRLQGLLNLGFGSSQRRPTTSAAGGASSLADRRASAPGSSRVSAPADWRISACSDLLFAAHLAGSLASAATPETMISPLANNTVQQRDKDMTFPFLARKEHQKMCKGVPMALVRPQAYRKESATATFFLMKGELPDSPYITGHDAQRGPARLAGPDLRLTRFLADC